MRRRRAARLALLALGAALLMGPTWPRDDSGVPAPVTVFLGSGGTPTQTSGTDPLPVLTGPPTQSTTDPTGWGKAFFAATGFPDTSVFSGYFTGDQDALAFAQAATGAPRTIRTFRTTNGGRTWALINTSAQSFQIANVGTVVKAGSRTILGGTGITGNDPSIVTSTDTVGWAGQVLPGSGAGQTVNFLFAQGNTILASVSTGGAMLVCRSTNGGSSFATCVDHAALGNLATGVRQNIASPSASVWLVADDTAGTARSTDDGVTFTQVLTLAAADQQLACLSSTICLHTDGINIRRSTDAGATWTVVQATGETGTAQGNGFLNFGGGVVVFMPNSSGSFRTWRSSDFGATWVVGSTLSSNVTTGAFPALVTSSGRGIIFGTDGNAVAYSPVVGAGETIIAGQSGSRWDINASGHGGVYQGAAAANSAAWPVKVIYPNGLINGRACSTPAANTAATITVTGVTGQVAFIDSYVAFYDVAPASPQVLTVTDAGTTIWRDIVNGANTPTRFSFGTTITGTTAGTIVVTLPAGGAGVSGSLCAVIGGPFAP